MKATRGFTLIELAVVIAIIAILAAVAIPRFGNTTAQAERAMINNMVSNLTSAASIFTAEQSQTPTDFSSFVTTAALDADDPETLSLLNFGTSPGNCNVAGETITCANDSFRSYTGVTYTWNGGAVTVTGNPVGDAPPLRNQ